MNETYFHKLSNGIRVVHRKENSQVSYVGFAINAGTRDEDEDESGLAHYIEHMLFKGTKKRRSWHILNRLETVGGELNAYTTKEETYVYAIVLKADYEKAVELCSDIVFNSTFPQSELEKETDVIIEEINSYNDSPAELIYDEFETLVFGNEQLGRNILGDEERLKLYTTEDAKKFVDRNYTNDRILFFSSGDLSEDKVLKICEKYFGHIESRNTNIDRRKTILRQPQCIRKSMQTHQTHALIGSRAYSMTDERRHSLSLLCNILGGPMMSSRLNMAIREKRGWAYTVETNYTMYSDDGIVTTYFGCDSDLADKCVQVARKEIQRMIDERLTEKQLSQYVNQFLSQMTISRENRENSVLAMAKSYLFGNCEITIEESESKLKDITADGLRDVAEDVLGKDKLWLLLYEE